MPTSKSKKRYFIQKRVTPGTYSSEVEAVAPFLFEWKYHPLEAMPDWYTTKKKAQEAVSVLTGSWSGWEFRVLRKDAKIASGTWRGHAFEVIQVQDD